MACGEVIAAGASIFQIDEEYEYSAPKFFDFLNDETEEEIRKAELWFENGKSDAPSPFMIRIKAKRFAEANSVLCDFQDANANHDDMDLEHQESVLEIDAPRPPLEETIQQEEHGGIDIPIASNILNTSTNVVPTEEKQGSSIDKSCLSAMANNVDEESRVPSKQVNATRTPGLLSSSLKVKTTSINSKVMKELMRPSSSLKHKTPSTLPGKDPIKPRSTPSVTQQTKTASEIAQENQAIKRQKLDDGKSRQIHNVKTRVLLHKSKPDLMKSMDSVASAIKNHCEEIKPYISVAEMIKKFESKPRELDLKSSFSHEDNVAPIQRRQRLVLTRPKEPEFQTAHRVRAVKIKSSEELEAEMLAKIPKFKARPVNKKILEAPSLPPLPKRAPQAPEFREFNLKTMERFEQCSITSSVLFSSSNSTCPNQDKVFKLTEGKPPVLETALRARPSRVKTTEEQELEELEKAPKFKARPLNKKIFESKGDIGLLCKPKGQLTIPQEFHFATNDRLGPPQSLVADLFDKLSLHSSEHNDQKNPQITIPNPFNLQTEERGMVKEKKFTEQLMHKQMEEERARVRKANPYPYTTDYPVVPPKPQPKECTKPATFQLESLVRHEEEQLKKMEMLQQMEKEEAERRLFRAQPIMKEDPIPIPEKKRIPLTEVQEIILHVDHRAEERGEFDKKVKEKELIHKRLREESEHVKLIEEEKAVKQMRRTMVPHAKPLPNFSNPFQPQKSTKDNTKPQSPKLRVAEREARRRRHYMR